MSEAKKDQWRIGRKVPINIYDGDRPVCQCHTVEDAKRIVRGVNGDERMRAAVKPFLAMLRTFPKMPRPVTPASYWDTPVCERDGVVLTIGDFGALASLVTVNWEAEVTEEDIASAKRLAERLGLPEAKP